MMKVKSKRVWHSIWNALVFRRGAGTEPIIVDRSLDRFIAISYLVLLGWGVAAIIADAPAVSQFAGERLSDWWAIAISVVALAAVIGSSFQRWWLEMYALSSLIGLIACYPISVIALALFDAKHYSSIFLTVYLLVLPVWRLGFLIRRTRRTGERHG